MKMPITILAGLVFVLVALVLYTIGVWGAFRAKAFRGRTLPVLWAGVVFDVLATLMMAIQPTVAVQGNIAKNAAYYIVTLGLGDTTLVLINDVKTYFALLALAAMAAFTGLAQNAAATGDSDRQVALSRWIVAPWVLWAAVFVYGMATKMPGRPG